MLNSTKDNMNNMYVNLVKCWRSIEEITPHIIETKSLPYTVENIVKEILGDKEIPWLVPYASRNNEYYTYYYTIFLGAIPLDIMLNKIKDLFGIKTQKYTENFNSEKRTCLAIFTLNDIGMYLNGQIDIPDYLITIAARIKYGNNYDTKENYAEIRNRICQQIKEIIENLLLNLKEPATIKELGDITENIFSFINWKDNGSEKLYTNNLIIYKHKIKTSKLAQKEENYDSNSKSYFNSYFLTDLKKVERDLQENKYHSTIFKYLSLQNTNRKDVRTTDYYRSTMVPQNIPYASWPNKNNLSLVLGQTLAVKESLETQDIFSINGPPGTGKTTLLKDIVSNIIFKKASKIAQLSSPEEFFTDVSFTFSSTGYNYKGWLLNEKFLDLVTVVASSNNEAVENITKELPFSIDKSWNVDYFKGVAEDIFDKKGASGLFSAILGNSSNRSNFFNKFWKSDTLDKNSNLENNSFKNILQFSTCNNDEWNKAKKKLETKIIEYSTIISELIELNYMFSEELNLKSKIDEITFKTNSIKIQLNDISNKSILLSKNIDLVSKNIELQKSLIEIEFRNKPTIAQILFALVTWRFVLSDWQDNFNILKLQLINYMKVRDENSKEIYNLELSKDNLSKDLSEVIKELSSLSEKYAKLIALKEKYNEIFSREGVDLPDTSFWQQDEEILQSLSPWLFPSLQKIRSELFILSNKFIMYNIR